MIKKWITRSFAALLFLVLTACEVPFPMELTGAPSRAPDMVTDIGIFVYFEPYVEGRDINGLSLNRDQIDQSWTETQDCIGMYSDNPPTILVVPDVTQWMNERGRDSDHVEGKALLQENLVLILLAHATQAKLFKHEFIHIVLHQNHVSNSLNKNHQPEYLWACQYEPLQETEPEDDDGN